VTRDKDVMPRYVWLTDASWYILYQELEPADEQKRQEVVAWLAFIPNEYGRDTDFL
jgi:hypothetical protein